LKEVVGEGTAAMRRLWAAGILVAATAAAAANGAPRGQTAPAAQLATVTFTNGDAVRARLVEIARGRAALALEVAADQPLSVELERIAVIEMPDANAAAADGEVLELSDGCRLVGRSIGFERGGLLFELREGGRILAPLGSVQSYRRADAATPEEAAINKHSVVADNGDVLVGDVSVGPNGSLDVKGTVHVKIAHRQVAAIYAPPAAPSEEEPAPASRPAERPLAVVALTYGALLAGRDLAVAQGALTLTLLGGQRITVPLRSVLRVEPAQSPASVAGAGFRNILAWGAWSDRDQEFPWTIEALKSKLPPGWKIHEDLSTSFDRDFQRRLVGCRALLVPEPENWGSDARSDLARQLKGLAERFCRAGGNIVVLGAAEGPLTFLREAGVIDAVKSGQSNTDAVNFTAAGKRIGAKVGASFNACNSTYFYRPGGTLKAESWAENPQGSAILARRVGRGWVILMGMDYYNRSDALNQLLVNAVLLR